MNALRLMVTDSHSTVKSNLVLYFSSRWAMWLASLAYEHVADHQKLFFIMECKKNNVKDAVCDVGLWRYRHVTRNRMRT